MYIDQHALYSQYYLKLKKSCFLIAQINDRMHHNVQNNCKFNLNYDRKKTRFIQTVSIKNDVFLITEY